MATYFVNQAGSGTADGSTLGNAASIATLNAHTASAGDIISLNGTITSQIVCHDSGGAGNVITYQFASGASCSTAAWGTTGAINLNGKQYITIDGNNTGIIECTDNGTSGSYGNQAASIGIYGSDVSHIVIKNLTVRNIYKRVGTTDKNANSDSTACILITASAGYTDITVSGCTINWAKAGVQFFYRSGTTTIQVNGNTIASCNWGVAVGDANTSCTVSGVNVYGNTITDCNAWDEPAFNTFHHDGIFLYAGNASSGVSSSNIYGNTLGPGISGSQATAGVYLSGVPGTINTVLVYNNVFVGTDGTPSVGQLYCRMGGGSTGNAAYNNTFVSTGNGYQILIDAHDSATQGLTLKNNLHHPISGTPFYIAVVGGSNLTLTSNNNLLESAGVGTPFQYDTTNTYTSRAYTYWQGTLSQDAASLTSAPSLDGNYVPQTGSPAITAGADLSGTFTTDFYGTTRRKPFTIGAFDGASGTSPPYSTNTKQRACGGSGGMGF